MRLLGANRFILILLVFMLVESFQNFQKSCRQCNDYICNCASQHIQHVPKASVNVLVLDLSFNDIESIGSDDLSAYREMKKLYLNNNKIRFIHTEAFRTQSRLEVLDLSSNLMQNISSSWFHKLKSLQQLNLLGNSYTVLGPALIFDSLQNLVTIRFGNPSLKEMYKIGLDGLTQLSEMTFVGRDMMFYQSGSLKTAQPLKSISLSLQTLFHTNPEIVSKILQDVSNPKTQLTIRDADLRTNISMVPFKEVRDGGTTSLTVMNSSTTDEAMTTFLVAMDGCLLSYIGLEDIHLVGQGSWEKAASPRYRNLRTAYIRNLDIQGFFGFSSMVPLAFLLTHFYKLSVINATVFVIPKITTILLRKVELLDLSQNLLSDLTIQETLNAGAFQNLNTLNISGNFLKSFGLVSRLLFSLKRLVFVDLSHNSFLFMPDKCRWPPTLTFLNLSSTKLSRVTSCLPSTLTILDLSENDLQAFDLTLPSLTALFLTGNRFMKLPHGEWFPRLETLTMQRNALHMLDTRSLREFANLRNLEAGKNNYLCSCEFVQFFRQEVDGLVRLQDGRQNYACDMPFVLRGDEVDDVRLSLFECHMIPAVASLCCGIVVVLAVIAMSCHKLHVVWYLRMIKAWIQAKRKPVVRLKNADLCYDAFVSYSQRDAEWVEEILVPELESAQPSFALCLHKRDFRPGRWIVDNIIDCIEKSHRTLFVLSEHFVSSEWCCYELDFSHFRIVDQHNDSAVLILLEPIKKETIPKRFCKLRKLMSSRTYLEWPEDEDKRSEFWSNLRAAMTKDE